MRRSTGSSGATYSVQAFQQAVQQALASAAPAARLPLQSTGAGEAGACSGAVTRPRLAGTHRGGDPPVRSALALTMDTVVQIEVASAEPAATVDAAMRCALRWFSEVEQTCSRFDPASEVRRLLTRVGQPVAASPILFEAVRFALALAQQTEGAFDPTIRPSPGSKRVRPQLSDR